MICFRFVSLSMFAVMIAGCGSSGSDANSPEGGGESKGYGYEFAADSTKNPKAAMTPSLTPKTGRLQPEVIQGVVRQNFDKFKTCYEAGLQNDRNIAGVIRARFVIKEDGTVADLNDDGSTLTDKKVRACVLEAFATIAFPKPEGGIVSVVYPLEFSP